MQISKTRLRPLAIALLTFLCSMANTLAQEPKQEFPIMPGEKEPPRLAAPKNAKAMPAPHRVWIDAVQKLVYVDGYVSLDEGLLEMFACTIGTKEHESVIAAYSSAQVVHAALLAVGAIPGHPVRWDPEFAPATGMEISIEIRWQDEKGKWKSMPAQHWMKDAETNKVSTHTWVFAGSRFIKDEPGGKEYYLAEEGSMICVSNFSTAMLDIPIESSQDNSGLLFEANKDNVPAIGTPVRMVLKPKLKSYQPKTKKDGSQKKDVHQKKNNSQTR